MIKTQKFYFLLPLFTEKGIMKHAQIRRIHVSPFLIIAAVIHTYAPISVCVILFFSKLMGMHMIRCSKRYISFITPYGLKYILVRNIINARLCCSLQKASKQVSLNPELKYHFRFDHYHYIYFCVHIYASNNKIRNKIEIIVEVISGIFSFQRILCYP